MLELSDREWERISLHVDPYLWKQRKPLPCGMVGYRWRQRNPKVARNRPAAVWNGWKRYVKPRKCPKQIRYQALVINDDQRYLVGKFKIKELAHTRLDEVLCHLSSAKGIVLCDGLVWYDDTILGGKGLQHIRLIETYQHPESLYGNHHEFPNSKRFIEGEAQ